MRDRAIGEPSAPIAERPARSLFDVGVDRYVAVLAWSPSRKTALVSGLMALTQGAIWGVTDILTPSGVVDVPQLVPLAAAQFVVTLWICALSLVVARTGRPGRWTVYVFVVSMTPFYLWLFHLYGTASTPLVAFYPMGVLLLMLVFDPAVAWFGFVLGTGFAIVLFALELGGAVAYAPIFIDRTIDAQRNFPWYANTYAAIQLAFLLPLVLVHFTVAANRRLQQQLAASNAEILGANRRLEGATTLIRRHVPAQLATRILSGELVEPIRPERRKLTLFFSDIAGFTAAADRLEPEDLAALLNEYLSEMAGIADAWGATIDQFVGDGIMIFFGAPGSTDDRGIALAPVRRGQQPEPSLAVFGAEVLLLVAGLHAACARLDPDLQEMHGVLVRRVEFAVQDTGTRAHALHVTGADHGTVAEVVAVLQRAVQHDREDLHVAVTVGPETLARLDAILIDHPQRAEAHVRRVVVVGEGKRVVGVQPAVIGMAPFAGLSYLDHLDLLVHHFR